MRHALHVLLLISLGCGGPGKAAKAPESNPIPAEVARAYPAASWIPAHPTYALAARTVRDAQHRVRDVINVFGGVFGGVEAALISTILEAELGVDALSPEALAAIGIDPDGGFAVFSEGLNPTFVVRLAAPDAMARFLAPRRGTPRTADGTTILTAELFPGLAISWVMSSEWLWLHVHLPFAPDDGTSWFAPSRHPKAPTWTADWAWAQESTGRGAPAFLGFLDLRRLLTSLSPRIPAAQACLAKLAPAGNLAVALDGDTQQASLRFAVDLGASAAALRTAVLPPPEGWAAAGAGAPLAAQLNVDLVAARAYLAPCLAAANLDLRRLDQLGLRTVRAIIREIDPRGPSGAGVVSADLASASYIRQQLDRIPFRSRLEKKKKFGAYDGVSLSVPFGPTVDYILDDKQLLAGLGDGWLARAVGQGAGTTNALVALDVAPGALGVDAWAWLLDELDVSGARRIAEQLLRWRHGRVAVTLDGTRVVLEVSGNRR
ncbi:MAG: hypothetical protein KF773_30145 [Deltaproteobacteria bacterium]|nr:hypothetical protein [Deltaproteobacteria bacterium]